MNRILLVSHDMSVTGAPKSLLEFAKVFRANRYEVDIWSYRGGDYLKSYREEGFEVEIIDEYAIFANTEEVVKKALRYDAVICNTIRTYALATALKYYVPTVWVIQEGKILLYYTEDNKDVELALSQKNDIYVVSEYAQEFVKSIWNCNSRVIHNYIPDVFSEIQERRTDQKVRFIAIGNIGQHKAYDVLLRAYNGLPGECLKDSELCLIGAAGADQEYNEEIYGLVAENPSVKYMGGMDNRAVLSEIAKADVAVIVSRDESCSLVALEGAMLGKPLIISENVGARYLVSEHSGWIVEANNIEALRKVMRAAIQDMAALPRLGECSRRNFLDTSTYAIYEENVLNLLKAATIPQYDSVSAMNRAREKEREEWQEIASDNLIELEEQFKLWGNENDVCRSKVVLFGTGDQAKYLYPAIRKQVDVVKWVDNHYKESYNPYMEVSSPDGILDCVYDYIVIVVININTYKSIKKQLMEMGVPEDRIKWISRRGCVYLADSFLNTNVEKEGDYGLPEDV